MRFVAIYSALLFAASMNMAWATSGPDNTYCKLGDQAAFGNHDGPAALPEACIYTSESATPSPGKTIPVVAGDDLQSVLNSVQCGETVSIQADATFVGNFHLNGLKCDSGHWITIRTAAPDASLPDEGTRLTPCYAGVGSLKERPDFQCTQPQRVIPQIVSPRVSPAFSLRNGANHYRLIGLELTRSDGTGFIGPLIGVEKDYRADHIIIDRVWAHGTTLDDTQSAVDMNGMTFAAVIDSYLNEFHCTWNVGACTDAHAITGGVSSQPGGPYKVVNNFLEASGENIMFGGGPATTTPTDIEVRRNHMYKPLIWKQGQPGYVGGKGGNPFVVLNLTELKNAQRVLLEGDVFEYSWGGFTQGGAVILLTPKSQYSKGKGVCPQCQVTDVTIRYSTASHSGMGIVMAAELTGKPKPVYQAKAAARYSVHDITIDDVSEQKYGAGVLFEIFNTWPKNGLNSILVDHVTAFGDPGKQLLLLISPTTNSKIPNVGFTNNLLLSGKYPIWSGGGSHPCATSVYPKDNLTTCLNPYSFSTNGIIGSPDNYPPSTWPKNNQFPADPEAVQFINYNNGDGGDYHLMSTSPYRNAGSDGKDLGADIDAINAHTAGVE